MLDLSFALTIIYGILSLLLLLQADGFPTLLFFPAGNKSFDPVRRHFSAFNLFCSYHIYFVLLLFLFLLLVLFVSLPTSNLTFKFIFSFF